MTLLECVKLEWAATPELDIISIQKAGLETVHQIITNVAKAIESHKPIEDISYHSTYPAAATAITNLLWRIATRYYNENQISAKLHINVVSFKGRGGQVTLEEVEALEKYIRDVWPVS